MQTSVFFYSIYITQVNIDFIIVDLLGNSAREKGGGFFDMPLKIVQFPCLQNAIKLNHRPKPQGIRSIFCLIRGLSICTVLHT